MMLHKTKGSGEALFSLILVLFSAAAFWQSYGISGFGGLTTAGMFPMLASATMLAAASFVLSGAVRSLSESDTDDRPVTAHACPVFSRELLIIVAMVAAYVAAMPYIGFVLSSALFLFAAFSYLWRKGLFLSLLITGVSIAVIYVVFRLGFQVVLPSGTWLRGVF